MPNDVDGLTVGPYFHPYDHVYVYSSSFSFLRSWSTKSLTKLKCSKLEHKIHVLWPDWSVCPGG